MTGMKTGGEVVATVNKVQGEGERRKILVKPMCVGGGHMLIGDIYTCVGTHILC